MLCKCDSTDAFVSGDSSTVPPPLTGRGPLGHSSTTGFIPVPPEFHPWLHSFAPTGAGAPPTVVVLLPIGFAAELMPLTDFPQRRFEFRQFLRGLVERLGNQPKRRDRLVSSCHCFAPCKQFLGSPEWGGDL